MKIAFISGHLDVTSEEFNTHYYSLIQKAIENNHNFVIGDAKGADHLAQIMLVNYPERVTIYHMFDHPRFGMNFPNKKGGYKSDDERDAAMTTSSDYDIAWIRPGREKSGTAKNINRRNENIRN